MSKAQIEAAMHVISTIASKYGLTEGQIMEQSNQLLCIGRVESEIEGVINLLGMRIARTALKDIETVISQLVEDGKFEMEMEGMFQSSISVKIEIEKEEKE